MKNIIPLLLIVACTVYSCKKTEDSPNNNDTQKISLTGIWQFDDQSEAKFIEFNENTYSVYYESPEKFKTVKTDSFKLTDSSTVMLSLLSPIMLYVSKTSDNKLKLGTFSITRSTEKPMENWFKTALIETEYNDVFEDNFKGIGAMGNEILICRPNFDYYDKINSENKQKTEVWMKGTVPVTIDSDDDYVYASSASSYSLLIHMASGGMAYEEIGGMGTLKGIGVQTGTPYLWLYSSNDTLYKYQKFTLKIMSRTYLGDGLNDACWHSDQLVFCKGSSIIRYDMTNMQVKDTYVVPGVKEIYGIASVNGAIWISADGNRLMKVKL